MIFSDFAKAVAQLGDSRFQKVLWKGVGLALLLLITACYGVFALVGGFAGDGISLPWIGTIAWLDEALSWGALVGMMVLSVFLMVPVASLMASLFLDEVADAVEREHYPQLNQAPRTPFAEGLSDTIRFLGVLIGANIIALVIYVFVFWIPFAPLILFWALNGYLLGREYFQLVAMRRLGREGAKAMRRRHRTEVWMAGCLMAVPLSIPLLNLFIPILGAATLTHVFHRLNRG